MANDKVSINDVVSLEYVLKLENGQEIDRSKPGSPLEFIQGIGQIIPGLEKELYDLPLGEEKNVIIEPADAYGNRDREQIIEFPRSEFPEDVNLVEGMGLTLQNQTGESFQARVVNVQPELVTLDFNHPLAGETLYFQVKVVDLRPASSEELSHGHVHTAGKDH